MKRLSRLWKANQWWIIVALGTMAVIATHWGLDERSPCFSEDCFYRTLQVFGIGRPLLAEPKFMSARIARWLFAAAALLALAKAWSAAFREQLDAFRLRHLSGHAIVCGAGEKGLHFARALRQGGLPVVLIESRKGNPVLEQRHGERMIVVTGDASDPEILRLARVTTARYVIATCGDDDRNARIATQTQDFVRHRSGSPLACIVHIDDPDLYGLVREREFADDTSDGFRLQCFNVFESGARVLVDEHHFEGTKSIPPHLLIVGLGRFGASVVLYAAQQWRSTGHKDTLRISVIDRSARERTDLLHARYPQLASTCTLLPLPMSSRSPDFERGAFLTSNEPTIVYVCLSDTTDAFAAALSLWQRTNNRIPIVVRTTSDEGLPTFLAARNDIAAERRRLVAFPLIPRTCQLALIERSTNTVLAQALHQEYVRSQQSRNETSDTNPSLVPWKDLPANLQESNRLQADHIGKKLAAVGCRLAPLTDWKEPLFTFQAEEVERLAQMEHERWMQERTRDGWHYGERKHTQDRISADLVGWERLTPEAKDKNRDAVQRLPALLALVGFRIVRDPGETVRRTRADASRHAIVALIFAVVAAMQSGACSRDSRTPAPVPSASPGDTLATPAPERSDAAPPVARTVGAESEDAQVAEIETLAADQSDKATRALLQSADSPVVLVSTASIRALIGRGCDRVEPLLIRFLDDEEWQRRAWAAKVLGANGCRGAQRALSDRLQNERDGRVQARLEEALQHLEEVGK